MKVLKWGLIVTGTLILALVVVIIGWVSKIETVKLTAADFEVGGSYPPEERQALFDACKMDLETGGGNEDKWCTCVADSAGSKVSRYERLMLTAVFEESFTKMVALTKALAFSGKWSEMQAHAEQRSNAVFEPCWSLPYE